MMPSGDSRPDMLVDRFVLPYSVQAARLEAGLEREQEVAHVILTRASAHQHGALRASPVLVCEEQELLHAGWNRIPRRDLLPLGYSSSGIPDLRSRINHSCRSKPRPLMVGRCVAYDGTLLNPAVQTAAPRGTCLRTAERSGAPSPHMVLCRQSGSDFTAGSVWSEQRRTNLCGRAEHHAT